MSSTGWACTDLILCCCTPFSPLFPEHKVKSVIRNYRGSITCWEHVHIGCLFQSSSHQSESDISLGAMLSFFIHRCILSVLILPFYLGKTSIYQKVPRFQNVQFTSKKFYSTREITSLLNFQILIFGL